MKSTPKLELPKTLRPNPQLVKSVMTTAKSVNRLDITNFAVEEVVRQIKLDPQNDFNFYNIQSFDKTRLKKKNGSTFASTHTVSELNLIKETKFFRNKHMSNMERSLRNRIKQEPGGLQLLGEM